MNFTIEAERDIRKTTLPNGLRIVTERVPHVRSVSTGVWITAGSRCERPEENGLSHFIEHMLFKGSAKRSVDDIAREIDSLGGELDAYTSREVVNYELVVLDEHLPAAFDVLSDMVLNPSFPVHEFEKERGVIIEELAMDADNPEHVVDEIFLADMWGAHPLGKPIGGSRELVSGFTLDSLRDFYRRIYRSENMLVAAAGNIDHDRFLEMASGYFEGVPSRNGDSVPDGGPPDTAAAIRLERKISLEQLHIQLGVPAFNYRDPDRFTLQVLNTLFGGCMSSRLFQSIRERLGLAYSVFSEYTLFHDTGLFLVCAGTSPASAKNVVAAIVDQIRLLKQQPVAEDELVRAKNNLKGGMLLGAESTANRVGSIAQEEINHGRFSTYSEIVKRLEAVTASDVQRVANRLFDPEKIAVTLLGNTRGIRLERGDLAC